MLPTLVHTPFHRPGWIYEEKYDGERILAYKEGDAVHLSSRNGKDKTARFPRIAAAIKNLPPTTLLLDGEVVVFDKRQVSRFQLLQEETGEPIYVVFDCLYCEGKDLRQQPLAKRRAVMEEWIHSGKLLLPSGLLAENGLDAFRKAKHLGVEGLVAKDLSSPYVEARTSKWLKVKAHQEDEFLIVGFTRPEGHREYFGALLLGAYDHQRLRYVGKVGTGFSRKTLATLYELLHTLKREKSALIDPPKESDITFVSPRLVAQIAFQEWTADRKLRQPVYLGLRDDKRPREILMPDAMS
jgi:bifunctional non-homologous end joining protein LigD